MKTSGIYVFRCMANGKIYVGQSKNIDKRKACHFSSLRGGYHENEHLQRSFAKHGESAFLFCVIEYVDIEMLDASEIFWIRFFKSDDGVHGYNSESGGNRNKIMSAETRVKISAAGMGRVVSQKTRQKMSVAQTGQKRSAEFCKRMGDIHRGKIVSAETIAKIKTAKAGFRHTAETKAKMSARRMGYIPTLEARSKMSAAHMGMKFSAEHRANISLAQKYRKPMSAESRRKLSESTRQAWINRKQKIAV